MPDPSSSFDQGQFSTSLLKTSEFNLDASLVDDDGNQSHLVGQEEGHAH